MASGTEPQPFNKDAFTDQDPSADYTSTTTTWQEAASLVMDNIAVEGKAICGCFFHSGAWMYMAYKYTGRPYGIMIICNLGPDLYTMKRYDGVDSFYSYSKNVIQ